MAKTSVYLTNKEFLAELVRSKEKGAMTNELAVMFMKLVSKYGSKGNWYGYSYNEDMQSHALVMCCKVWDRFDATKSNNPFAFFTQVIKNEFISYLNQEKKQSSIRDDLLIDAGVNPSYGYEGEKHADTETSSEDNSVDKPEANGDDGEAQA